MHCVPLPQFVIKKIYATCRTFIQAGSTEITRKSPFSWKTCCQPRVHGGLGICNFTIWNKITKLKCLWNISTISENFLVKWVHAYFLKGQHVMEAVAGKNSSWIIQRIMTLREDIQQYNHVWDKMISTSRFKMSLMYTAILDNMERVKWRHLFRQNAARPKALHTNWMACHEKLPIKERMKRFHMINEDRCSLCNQEVKTMEHLLFQCRITKEIWSDVLHWMEITNQPKGQKAKMDWILAATKKKGCRARVLKLAFAETIYGVWQYRNQVVFRSDTHRKVKDSIIDFIVYRGWQ